MNSPETKYHVRFEKGLIDFNSLSKDGRFYYQITKPFDFYWGLWLTRISFLDIEGNIIYHNNLTYATPLDESNEKISSYASFSLDGSLAYYLERIDLNTIKHILIHLVERKVKSLIWSETNKTQGYILQNEGFSNLELFNDVEWKPIQTTKRKERNILLRKIWFPK